MDLYACTLFFEGERPVKNFPSFLKNFALAEEDKLAPPSPRCEQAYKRTNRPFSFLNQRLGVFPST